MTHQQPFSLIGIVSDTQERARRVIEALSEEDRQDLIAWMQRQYRFEISDDRAKFTRPWSDPRHGFGRQQHRLLTILDRARGAMLEADVIRRLWPQDVDRAGKRARARLRQLVKAVRDRLAYLKLAWIITRPEAGFLQLVLVHRYGTVRRAA